MFHASPAQHRCPRDGERKCDMPRPSFLPPSLHNKFLLRGLLHAQVLQVLMHLLLPQSQNHHDLYHKGVMQSWDHHCVHSRPSLRKIHRQQGCHAEGILTGGSEFPPCIPAVGGFSSMKALSERNDDPKTASRPYDKDRDGFVIGEGAGALILEELEHAKARGAKIYCEVMGGGMSGDAYHISAPHPEGIGVIQVMHETLKDANMKAEEIDYINTHGTSTTLGDIAELKAIKAVFGDHAYKLSISSTKSMTGHMLGAAGAAA